MGKRSFKTIKLLFKLMLLFQIYSHHKFEVDAAQNYIPTNCDDECDGSSGLNNQIFENKAVYTVLDRPKRPARLLPLRMFRGKEKNQTEIEDMANKRFYGPATSCEELLKIGYTRNGFYLIKGNATSNNSHHVEIVDCLFKHSNGVKEVKEKRLGPIPLKTKETEHRQRRSVEKLMDSVVDSVDGIGLERSKRPARLLPHHLLYGKEKNDTEEENVPKPFYGPPGNCVDLSKLGYTLNGYYLVNGSKSSSSIEVVLCRFQLPSSGVNKSSTMEERIGFINLDGIKVIMDKVQSPYKKLEAIVERKNRPVRLLPPRYRIQKEEKKTAEQNFSLRRDSNPVNCNDIGTLGYTLNGYYLVNSSESAGQFGVSFCQFKLPPGAVKSMKEEIVGFINLFEKIRITSDETKKLAEQPNNCKNPLVLIKEEENGTRCMELDARIIRFYICDSSNPFQHWEILKSENDRNNIRICIRRMQPWFSHDCLFASFLFPQNLYRMSHVIHTIEPSNEARELYLSNYNQSDPSQHWLVNSTTHQLSNAQYPKGCLTTRHFSPHPAIPLLLECDGYGYEYPNPQLSKHQRFYQMPALDKNGKQLCLDSVWSSAS